MLLTLLRRIAVVQVVPVLGVPRRIQPHWWQGARRAPPDLYSPTSAAARNTTPISHESLIVVWVTLVVTGRTAKGLVSKGVLARQMNCSVNIKILLTRPEAFHHDYQHELHLLVAHVTIVRTYSTAPSRGAASGPRRAGRALPIPLPPRAF